MKFGKHTIAAIMLFLIAGGTTRAQAPAAAGQQTPAQGLAQLKSAMAANKAKLMKYQWTESTDVSLKGKTRKDEQKQCRYGPDGKVQKTLIGPPPQAASSPGGLRGRVVEKKVGELKDYAERLKALLSHYAPPEPELIQESKQAGKASFNVAGGQATLKVHDYYKTGDSVSFALDAATKQLVGFNVNTYLDDPKKDIVTLTTQFAKLPDGTNYLQKTVLTAQEKEIQITTTNSGYSPVNP